MLCTLHTLNAYSTLHTLQIRIYANIIDIFHFSITTLVAALAGSATAPQTAPYDQDDENHQAAELCYNEQDMAREPTEPGTIPLVPGAAVDLGPENIVAGSSRAHVHENVMRGFHLAGELLLSSLRSDSWYFSHMAVKNHCLLV